jgi:hypothetical protein
MSKFAELSATLDEMIACGNGLVKAAEDLKKFYASEDEPKSEPKKVTKKTAEPEKTTPAKEDIPSYSKEDVRAMLSKKANEDDGRYKAEVKELVKKYANGGTLKDVHPECYPALVDALEKLNNA